MPEILRSDCMHLMRICAFRWDVRNRVYARSASSPLALVAGTLLMGTVTDNAGRRVWHARSSVLPSVDVASARIASAWLIEAAALAVHIMLNTAASKAAMLRTLTKIHPFVACLPFD